MTDKNEMIEAEEFPLYPELPDGGAEAVQQLMDRFKEQMQTVCDDVLSDLYTDVSCYVECDHWTNYRNKMMDGFKDYNTRNIESGYDFKEIRQQIYKDFREEIIVDLNQDLVEEVAKLKETIRFMDEHRRMM